MIPNFFYLVYHYRIAFKWKLNDISSGFSCSLYFPDLKSMFKICSAPMNLYHRILEEDIQQNKRVQITGKNSRWRRYREQIPLMFLKKYMQSVN